MDLLLLPILCLFTSLATDSLGKSAPKRKPKTTKRPFPFPALEDNIIPFDSSTPFFKFDGIDYDELPPQIKENYYSCIGEFITCIRNTIYLNYVCSRSTYYDSGYYYSLCQLEVNNCHSRIYWNQGLYGTYYGNDIALYQGEGYYCQYSQNRHESRRLGQLNFVMVPFRPSDTYMSNHIRLRNLNFGSKL